MNRFAQGMIVLGLACLANPLFAQQAGQQGGQAGNREQTHPGMSHHAWFNDPGIRKQLGLTEEQYNKLSNAYRENWKTFQSSMGGLSNLNEQQRHEKMQQNMGAFHSNITKQADQILDAQARKRFHELALQHRGYDAFNDPEVQRKLNLTDEQKRKLSEAGVDYHTKMLNQAQKGGTGEEATRHWTESRRKMMENIGTILTEQQRQTWRELTGEPYNFHAATSQQSPSTNSNQPKQDR